METERQSGIGRRKFIATISGIGAARLTAKPLSFSGYNVKNYKAILFDAFPIFDPRPVFQLASDMFGEKGLEFTKVWKTKQFEYTWLRAAAGKYRNFWEVTRDALTFAGKAVDVTISEEDKARLMNRYLSLDTWQDVLPALKILKQHGMRLCFLSNMTHEMLSSCIKYSGTDEFFEKVLSTDSAKTYKPHANAYQLGLEELRIKKEEVLFVAFAGWDAAGAKWFGYPTFWVNRLQSPLEELTAIPDGSGTSMTGLIDFLNL